MWFFLSTLNYDARSTTHQISILFSVKFFPSKIVPFVRKCLKTWQIRIGHIGKCNISQSYCILGKKAIDTHSEYVALIAFPWQQFSRERYLLPPSYVHRLSYLMLNAHE